MYPCLKFLVRKDLAWGFHVSLFEVFGTKAFWFQCVDDGGGGGAEGFLELPVILVELVEHAWETFDWKLSREEIITTHLNSPRRNSPVESQEGTLWILKTVKEPVNLKQESQEGTRWILKNVEESVNPQQEETCDNTHYFGKNGEKNNRPASQTLTNCVRLWFQTPKAENAWIWSRSLLPYHKAEWKWENRFASWLPTACLNCTKFTTLPKIVTRRNSTG